MASFQPEGSAERIFSMEKEIREVQVAAFHDKNMIDYLASDEHAAYLASKKTKKTKKAKKSK